MNKYWIWFSRINKIGAKLQNQLLEKYKSPEVIWNIEKEEIENGGYKWIMLRRSCTSPTTGIMMV